MLIPKQNRIRDEKHRRWIASLPCLVSGSTEVQCAHISHGRNSMGLKAGDDRCVPLSWKEHQIQHQGLEIDYWAKYGGITKVIELAEALYEISGDTDTALKLIAKWKT